MTDRDKYIYSGTFTGSQLGGAGSQFVQNVVATDPDVVRLRALVAELKAQVTARSDEIDRPELAARDADDLLDEAARPAGERDKGRIADAFRRLRERLRPVADFADSLSKIAELVGKFTP